jgi:hypothetical protein
MVEQRGYRECRMRGATLSALFTTAHAANDLQKEDGAAGGLRPALTQKGAGLICRVLVS